MVQQELTAPRGRAPQLVRRRRLAEAVTFALASIAVASASANPQLPTVVNGQVSFATQGHKLTVTNSNGAIINWGSFSIAPGETTQFNQASSTSEVLNRVTGGDPSLILGSLLSNGRVFLINPNGVAFGPGSQVDVGSFVVSTLNLSNSSFLSGKLDFTANAGAGRISNAGTIEAAPAGTVYLVAPQIANSGVIIAPNGDILLAAGASVNLVDAANPALSVEIDAPAAQVVNLGRMVARGVSIYGGVVEQGGVIAASSAVRGAGGAIILKGSSGVTLDADSETRADGTDGGDGGTILVQAHSGTTLVAGAVSAQGTHGGAIALLGQDVGLTTATVDASGSAAGGQILVGGSSRGADTQVQNAQSSYIGSAALLAANASAAGSGGSVVVYSTGLTSVYGSIAAAGGASGGTGGSVETSGHYLALSGVIDVGAAHGHAGSWLLDPYDVTIQASGPDTNTSGAPDFTANGNSAIVTTGSVQTA